MGIGISPVEGIVHGKQDQEGSTNVSEGVMLSSSHSKDPSLFESPEVGLTGVQELKQPSSPEALLCSGDVNLEVRDLQSSAYSAGGKPN